MLDWLHYSKRGENWSRCLELIHKNGLYIRSEIDPSLQTMSVEKKAIIFAPGSANHYYFFSIYLVVTWLFGGNLDTITGRKKVHLFVFRPNIHQRKIRSRQFLSLFSMFLLTTMGTKLLQRLRSFLSEDLIISRVMNHVTCYKFECSYCIGWDYL